MIQIKIESLKTFLRNTAAISRNDLLPILRNIKIHQDAEGKFYATKNNIQVVCIHPIEATGELQDPVLIDQAVMSGLVEQSVGETVTLKVEGGTLTWDNNGVTELPLEDYTNYPLPSDAPDPADAKLISQEVMDAIGSARHYVNQSASAANFRFVCVNNKHVSAFHGQYFYVGLLKEEAAQLMLSREECDIILGLQQVTHNAAERQNYFYSNVGATYIFGKPEERPHKLDAVLKGLADPGGKQFTMPKQDWVSFCTKANIVNQSETALCSLLPNGEFKMEDGNFSRKQQNKSALVGTADEFKFNSKLIAAPLKAVPYETLQCKTNQNFLIIRNEESSEYFTFIGMQK